MRPLASISVLIALLISGFAPERLVVCHQMRLAAVCHRVATVHHCDMAMDDETAPANDSQLFLSSAAGAKCPMQCCTTARLQVTKILPPRVRGISLDQLAEKLDIEVTAANGGSRWSLSGRGPPCV